SIAGGVHTDDTVIHPDDGISTNGRSIGGAQQVDAVLHAGETSAVDLEAFDSHAWCRHTDTGLGAMEVSQAHCEQAMAKENQAGLVDVDTAGVGTAFNVDRPSRFRRVNADLNTGVC